MHILQIIDTFNIGGAQKLLELFGSEALNQNFRVSFICLSDRKKSPIGLDLEKKGFAVKYFPAKMMFDVKRIGQINLALLKDRPDLIHTNLLYSNILGGLLGWTFRIPVVATLHLTSSDSRNSKVKDWIESQVLRYLDRRVIAVGKKTAEANQTRLHGKKIDVIPNAVSSEELITNQERLKIRQEIMNSDRGILLISAGRFSVSKNFGDLIRAFELIHNDFPESRLVLAGDGKTMRSMQDLAANLHLTEFIKFLGQRNDVPRLLAASDLFLSSSIEEGMPLVILEALVAGLPVVATEVGDIPRLITDDFGILVPPRQPPKIADAVIELLKDRPRMNRLGENSRIYAKQNIASKTWMAKYLDLYAEVLKKRIE